MKLFRYQVKAQTSYLFFLIVFLLHCSGIRDKKFFSNIFFVKIEISKKLIFNLYD